MPDSCAAWGCTNRRTVQKKVSRNNLSQPVATRATQASKRAEESLSVETQLGIDNHHLSLLSLIVSVFHKLRMHHIAILNTLTLQSGNSRKKLCKAVLFKGF